MGRRVGIGAGLAAALLVTNSQWLSDIFGGTYLGFTPGGLVPRRLAVAKPSRERQLLR